MIQLKQFQIVVAVAWCINSCKSWIKDESSCRIQEKVICELESSMKNEDTNESSIDEILKDLSKGKNIWNVIHGLSSSTTFREEYWHKKPLLVDGSTTNHCMEGLFTIEKDLKVVGDSYITGHRTADSLRSTSSTANSWEFVPLKKDLSRRTTYEEVADGLQGGTIYFNTAGSLWPSLGALCKLSNLAFGLPSNINIYITPPKISVSVPPHTDKQDVFILQTAGSKHWYVYAPPKRKENVDPLSRGKNTDVMTQEELGSPLVDTVLRPGDILYIPHGFPHTTHTSHDNSNDETSIHLTLGLDTHVWFLTFAHLRWAILQKTKKPFAMKITNDDLYWNAMDSLPIGFLASSEYNWSDILSSFDLLSEYVTNVIEKLKSILMDLEPDRWVDDNDPNNELPSEEQMKEVIEYMVTKHVASLLKVQEEMYSNVDPHSEDTILKAYKGTQDLNRIMEEFALFCGNEAMARSYATMRQQREDAASK